MLADDGNLNSGSFTKWNPIGKDGVPYEGTFDGHGHIVSGLYCSGFTLSYLGLFGNIGTSGVVKNVNISDAISWETKQLAVSQVLIAVLYQDV